MNSNTQQQNNPLRTSHTVGLDRYIEFGVYIALLCNFFILWGNSQGITLFISWPTRIMVTYIFLLAVVLMANNLFSNRVGVIDTVFVVFVVFSVLCFVVSGSLGAIVSYMCFLMLPACLVLYRNITNVRNIKRVIYIANFFYALLFVYLSRQTNSHYAYGAYGVEIVDELTLGYPNANETGIYLMLSYLIFLVGILNSKKLLTKGLQLVAAMVVGNMLIQTNSRICIVIGTVATLLVFLFRWVKLGSFFRWLILLLPAITLLLVLTMPDKVESMTFMEEALDTGRYGLYTMFFQNMTLQNWLFGNGISGNMHNSYLSVLATYGLPMAILYVVLLNEGLKEIQKKAKKAATYAAYIGVLAVVAHGVAEGTLLTAGAVYAGLAGLLFVLALPEEENK